MRDHFTISHTGIHSVDKVLILLDQEHKIFLGINLQDALAAKKSRSQLARFTTKWDLDTTVSMITI
jgi:hypothetical protein